MMGVELTELQRAELSRRLHQKSKLNEQTQCMEWIGQVHSDARPYGRIYLGKKYGRGLMAAHRLSYEIHKGSIPDGMAVCHQCDNPRCINPDHLWLGTWKDNAQDCVRKGRYLPRPRTCGEASTSSKITDEIASQILASSLSGRKAGKLFGLCERRIRQIRAGNHGYKIDQTVKDNAPIAQYELRVGTCLCDNDKRMKGRFFAVVSLDDANAFLRPEGKPSSKLIRIGRHRIHLDSKPRKFGWSVVP